jgi:hypothetical protein
MDGSSGGNQLPILCFAGVRGFWSDEFPMARPTSFAWLATPIDWKGALLNALENGIFSAAFGSVIAVIVYKIVPADHNSRLNCTSARAGALSAALIWPGLMGAFIGNLLKIGVKFVAVDNANATPLTGSIAKA